MTMKPDTAEVLQAARKWLESQRGTPYWDDGDELLEQLVDAFAVPARVRFHDPTAAVSRIEGRLEFDDATSHEFSIDTDGQWQQWGAPKAELGRSVDLLEELTQTALAEGHLNGRNARGEDNS